MSSSTELEPVCLAGFEPITFDNMGIQCVEGHHICTECASTFIDVLISEPNILLPPKCPVCTHDIILDTIEMLLDDEKLNKFRDLLRMSVLLCNCKEGEVIISCPICNIYTEVRADTDLSNIVCKNVSCRKTTCFCCRLEYQLELIDNQVDPCSSTTSVPTTIQHDDCLKYYRGKRLLEKAIYDGSVVKCPSCKTAGHKEDGCAHITCPKCSTMYCYICGISARKCNKAIGRRDAPIYRHNVRWQTNCKRCPMYLYRIYEIDVRWPQSDAECVDFFHRKRILMELRTLFQNERTDYLLACETKYNVLKKADINKDEIMNEDLTLIRRNKSKCPIM